MDVKHRVYLLFPKLSKTFEDHAKDPSALAVTHQPVLNTAFELQATVARPSPIHHDDRVAVGRKRVESQEPAKVMKKHRFRRMVMVDVFSEVRLCSLLLCFG